jgi:hypothetical protein
MIEYLQTLKKNLGCDCEFHCHSPHSLKLARPKHESVLTASLTKTFITCEEHILKSLRLDKRAVSSWENEWKSDKPKTSYDQRHHSEQNTF